MPSLGMLTINALASADSVLIPVQAAYLPVKGLQQLIKTIGRVKRQLNPGLQIEGILLTMVDNRTNYVVVSHVRDKSIEKIKANIKLTINTSNQQIVECSSYFKHNLLPGNYVSFYYYLPHYKILDKTNEFLKVYENFAYLETDLDEFGVPKDGAKQYKEVLSKEFVRYSIKVKVQTVGDLNGDNKDRVFTVKYDDVKEIYDNMQNFGCFYKKNNGNTDCLYYFRKFKKIKSVIGDDIRSDVNKIAFAKNIYGDDIAQVVFTDDIDIDGLLDHNGRPVSDIFFTIIKWS